MAKTTVMTKARNQRGIAYPSRPTEFEVDVMKDYITVYKDGIRGRSFQVGDQAEYDSYNLRYLGQITKITAKCVTIVAYFGTRSATTHRLDLQTFCWRNYKLDVAATVAYNQEESMYI